MSDHLAALRLFARIAHRGSFSAAARELGVPQSTASRMIAVLEREIGGALLVRNTRAVTLTDAGSEFLLRLETILADLDEAEHAVRGTGELRGTIRVALGSSLAIREVIPRLPPFLDRHPALKVELMPEDRYHDLVTEGIDVALRFGKLLDSSATFRTIRAWPRVLAASPAYLAKAGAPQSPADLSAHSLVWGLATNYMRWSFRRNGAQTSIRVKPRLLAGSNEGAVAAATAGLGIIMTTSGACRRELEAGSLVRLLSEWDLGELELNAVFAAGRAAKPSARAYVTYLISALAGA
jgi:DNA-binding transcriptional LysR family regulator